MKLKKLLLGVISLIAVFTLAACGSGEDTIRIGVVGENNEPWDFTIDKLAEQGINAELVVFSDYNQPNQALQNGDIDLNAFQHKQFLDSYNSDHDTNITPIADTVIAPLGLYSEQVSDVSEIQEGDTISIPNDVSNSGRSLLLLQTAGLIEVDPEAGVTPTIDDITSNPLNLQIEPLDAGQTARSTGDVTAAVINSGMAVDAGYVPTEDSIFLEPVNEEAVPYVNIIAANEGDDREVFQEVIDAYQSEDTAQVIEESTKGASIPAWDQ